MVITIFIGSFSNLHVITDTKLRLYRRGHWRIQTSETKCDTEHIMKLKWLYKNSSECELNSWPDSGVGYSLRSRFSGCEFKSHLGQLSIATSKNPPVLKTICISSFSNAHVIAYRKPGLNKRGNWRRETAETKYNTEQIMKLEWHNKVGSECELNSWPDSSVF